MTEKKSSALHKLKISKLKGIIFDLDGTLANTVPLCIEAFKKSIEPVVKRKLSNQEIINTFGPSEEGTIKIFIPKDYKKGVVDYLHFYKILHNDMCPAPFKGIEEVLATLKKNNIHIAMVTGKGKYSTDISLKQFNIKHFFELIETGSPQGSIKEKGILSVLKKWKGIKKNEIAYVGDMPTDITTCQNIGIPIIAVAWADNIDKLKLEELHPDKIFYTVNDFSNWLLQSI